MIRRALQFTHSNPQLYTPQPIDFIALPAVPQAQAALPRANLMIGLLVKEGTFQPALDFMLLTGNYWAAADRNNASRFAMVFDSFAGLVNPGVPPGSMAGAVASMVNSLVLPMALMTVPDEDALRIDVRCAIELRGVWQ